MNVLFVLSPAFHFFPFPPWAVGALLPAIQATGASVDFCDLHAGLHWCDATHAAMDDVQSVLNPGRLEALLSDKVKLLQTNPYRQIADALPPIGHDYDWIFISNSLGQPESYIASVLIAHACRERFRGKIIIGGEAVQYGLLRRMLAFLDQKHLVDAVAVGPGEGTLRALLSGLTNRDVPGLVYVDGDGVQSNTPGEEPICNQPDFSNVSLAAYAWDPARYWPPDVIEREQPSVVHMLPARFIRGCPYSCAFCKESGSRSALLYLPAEELADRVVRIGRRHGVHTFHFLHSTLNVTRDYLAAFCSALQESRANIAWSDCLRPDGFDAEMAELARGSGALRVIFGMETASQRQLRAIGKKLQPEQVSRALRAASNAGIWTGLEVIVGFPGETCTDRGVTLSFLQENRRWIDEIWVNRFFLDVRSRMFQEPSSYGIAEVQDRRLSRDLGPFDYAYPSVRFRTTGRTFDDEEELGNQAIQEVIEGAGIPDGDALGFSSFCALAALRHHFSPAARLRDIQKGVGTRLQGVFTTPECDGIRARKSTTNRGVGNV